MKKQLMPALFDSSLWDKTSFGSLMDNSVGFDDMFNRIFYDLLPAANSTVKYPPYNIRVDDEHTRTIEMALAGYDESDIEILVDDGHLVVKGNKVSNIDDTNTDYVYRGVAARSFERKFVLADGAEVTDATMKNGMLNVTVVTKLPLQGEPQRILINGKSHEDPTET